MPFRRTKKRPINLTNEDAQSAPSSKRFVITCVALAICLPGVSAHAFQSGCWTWRLPAEIQWVMARRSDDAWKLCRQLRDRSRHPIALSKPPKYDSLHVILGLRSRHEHTRTDCF
jgi:hypothetical protein